MQIRKRAAFCASTLLVMGTLGCSSGSDTEGTTTSNTSSSSGGGEGGAGGGTTAQQGPSVTDIVTAGEVGTSPNYKMLFTFGQSTQNQGKTTSPSYGLQGGLVGANGSKP